LFIPLRYNIGHVGISLGDLGLAYQAFKVAVSINSGHGEALNNIAVLEMRRQKFDVAKSCLSASCDMSPYLFEPLFNSGKFCFVDRLRNLRSIFSALMSYRMGDFQDAFTFAAKALKVYPNHLDSRELQSLLQKTFLNT
jgi:tetratricopeptide repeat protein 8